LRGIACRGRFNGLGRSTGFQSFWSRKAREKGIRTEENLARNLRD